MKTKPKLLLNDTKPGIDEGQQSWSEPFYSFVRNDDSSGSSSASNCSCRR